jgi:K(+)-stimulated pyrophosphate-energized sodium pump
MQLTPLSAVSRRLAPVFYFLLFAIAGSVPLRAQGGEADLKLPSLDVPFLNGAVNGPTLLYIGLAVSVLGFVFGLVMYTHLRNLAVHESMREISELIYETCKTYLLTQGKFLLILEIFIGAMIVLYFGVLSAMPAAQVLIILAFTWRGSAFA